MAKRTLDKFTECDIDGMDDVDSDVSSDDEWDLEDDDSAPCPHCGAMVSAADFADALEKAKGALASHEASTVPGSGSSGASEKC